MTRRVVVPRFLRGRAGLAADGLLIALALAMQLATPPHETVERAYSDGVYPAIDRTIRFLTQPLPFALGDLFAVVLALGLVLYVARAIRSAVRGRRWRTTVRPLLRIVAVLAIVFVWFLAAWAYNYSRVPLVRKVPVHNERTNEDTVNALAEHVIDRLNADAAAAHGELALPQDELARRLRPTFEATIARLGARYDIRPYRSKPTIFDRFMSASGTTGFTDPWTHEVNLPTSLFAWERPAIYAHEWSHLAGFADETEANYIAVIACTTARDPLLRYSGWLLVWGNLPPTVKFSHRFARLPFDDITAIRNRYLALVKPQIQQATHVAYDRYLKANHVKAGYDSYALFIRWLTGADYDRSGLPIVRSHVSEGAQS